MPLLCSVRLPWFSQAPLRARLPLAAGVDASAPGPGSSLRQRPGLSHPRRARDLGDNMNAARQCQCPAVGRRGPREGGFGAGRRDRPLQVQVQVAGSCQTPRPASSPARALVASPRPAPGQLAFSGRTRSGRGHRGAHRANATCGELTSRKGRGSPRRVGMPVATHPF